MDKAGVPLIEFASTWGKWADTTNQHINYLELKAIHFAIKSYYKIWPGAKHLRIRWDIMGETMSDNCNNLAKDIWIFCIKVKVWISAEHIPGSEKYMAVFYLGRLMTIQNDNFLLSYFRK